MTSIVDSPEIGQHLAAARGTGSTGRVWQNLFTEAHYDTSKFKGVDQHMRSNGHRPEWTTLGWVCRACRADGIEGTRQPCAYATARLHDLEHVSMQCRTCLATREQLEERALRYCPGAPIAEGRLDLKGLWRKVMRKVATDEEVETLRRSARASQDQMRGVIVGGPPAAVLATRPFDEPDEDKPLEDLYGNWREVSPELVAVQVMIETFKAKAGEAIKAANPIMHMPSHLLARMEHDLQHNLFSACSCPECTAPHRVCDYCASKVRIDRMGEHMSRHHSDVASQ